MIVVQIIVAEK